MCVFHQKQCSPCCLMSVIRATRGFFPHLSSPWLAACGDDIPPMQGGNCCWVHPLLSLSSPARCLTFVSVTDRCSSRLLRLKQQLQPKQLLWLETYQDLDQWEESLQLLVSLCTCYCTSHAHKQWEVEAAWQRFQLSPRTVMQGGILRLISKPNLDST